MKVLFILPIDGNGGTEKQIQLLAEKLITKSVSCDLIYMRSNQYKDNFRIINNRKYFNFPKSPLRFQYFLEALKLARHLRKVKYDIVQSVLPEAVILSQLLLRKFLIGSVFISSVRGEHIKIGRSQITKYIYGKCLRRSEKVVCNSPSLKDHVVKQFKVNPNKVIYIPNGLQAIASLNPRKSEIGNRVIIISNLHVYKGFDILFSALKLVNLNLEVHIVGSGPILENFEKQICELPLNVTLIVHGFTNPSSILSTSSFAIHPSLTEGQSNAILEELASGLPVIAFNVGGNSSLVFHELNGLLLDEVTPTSLAKAINRLASDALLCQRLSQNAFESSKLFSSERLASNYLHLYQTLARHK